MAELKEPISTIVVDDEPPGRRRIRDLLASEEDFEVVRECRHGAEAIEAIRELKPDLVFLDVQMPEVDGFGVVEAIGPAEMPMVVFVTAYDQHALKAFDVHALDYLLKPFDAERFRHTLDRVRARANARDRDELDVRLRGLLAQLRRPESPYLDRITVRSLNRLRLINVSEIDYFEAQSNYVRLHVGEKSYLIRETLSGLEEKLDPLDFLRIHRSYIVNLTRVQEMEPMFSGEYVLFLNDGRRLTSGRSFKRKVQEIFGVK